MTSLRTENKVNLQTYAIIQMQNFLFVITTAPKIINLFFKLVEKQYVNILITFISLSKSRPVQKWHQFI